MYEILIINILHLNWSFFSVLYLIKELIDFFFIFMMYFQLCPGGKKIIYLTTYPTSKFRVRLGETKIFLMMALQQM